MVCPLELSLLSPSLDIRHVWGGLDGRLITQGQEWCRKASQETRQKGAAAANNPGTKPSMVGGVET